MSLYYSAKIEVITNFPNAGSLFLINIKKMKIK